MGEEVAAAGPRGLWFVASMNPRNDKNLFATLSLSLSLPATHFPACTRANDEPSRSAKTNSFAHHKMHEILMRVAECLTLPERQRENARCEKNSHYPSPPYLPTFLAFAFEH